MSVSSAGLPPAGGPPVAATETVIAVALYTSPFSCAAWRRMGPAGIAAYTAGLLAAPGLPELVGAVLAAERDGTLTDPARLAAARRTACRTVTGPARRTAPPARHTPARRKRSARHTRSARGRV